MRLPGVLLLAETTVTVFFLAAYSTERETTYVLVDRDVSAGSARGNGRFVSTVLALKKKQHVQAWPLT